MWHWASGSLCAPAPLMVLFWFLRISGNLPAKSPIKFRFWSSNSFIGIMKKSHSLFWHTPSIKMFIIRFQIAMIYDPCRISLQKIRTIFSSNRGKFDKSFLRESTPKLEIIGIFLTFINIYRPQKAFMTQISWVSHATVFITKASYTAQWGPFTEIDADLIGVV